MSTVPTAPRTAANTALVNGTVLIAGASSSAGVACARSLAEAGAAVVAVGTDIERLDKAMQGIESVRTLQCDLTDFSAVQDLRTALATDGITIDGVIHLVGGWRGGKGIPGQTDEDWDFLHRLIVTTLRNVSRVFYNDIEASAHGRYAIVSATAVHAPTAGGASYAAAKSAAETWLLAMAQGLAKTQSGRKQEPVPQHSAATVLVIKALLDEQMIAAEPNRSFPGYTHVDELATAARALFSAEAAQINGERMVLAH